MANREFDKTDPPRPITAPVAMKLARECEHPWHRLALVAGTSIYKNAAPDTSTLECYDCGSYLKLNGHFILFRLV